MAQRSVSQHQSSKASPRKQAWGRIQNEEPELAELMSQVRARFGRIRRLRVELRGEQVWPPPQDKS